MRSAYLLLALLPTLAIARTPHAWAEGSEPISAGKISRRDPSVGPPYAIYAPKTWRKRKPVSLVIHVVMERTIPLARLRGTVLPREADQAAQDGFVAVHAAVLLESHNKENISSKATVDRERYVRFLERDVEHVAAVIEDIAAEIPIHRDSVFIRGMRFAGEAAMGVAARRPDLFAGVMGIDMAYSVIGWAEDDFVLPWAVLPVGELLRPAFGLPVFMTHLPGSIGDTGKKARKVKLIQALLRGLGFRHVEVVTRTEDADAGYYMTPEGWAWLTRRAAKQRVRAQKIVARDKLLDEGRRQAERGSLSSALRAWRKAQALEVEHDLDPSSEDLYGLLEAQGRAMLADADDLSSAKRRALLRKVARLYQGTPLGEEVDAMLAVMK